MAFNLNNLLSTLDSSIGLLDSSSDLLSILQAINVTNPTMGHGKSQKKTYATRASLPAASVSLRGSLAVVQVIGDWQAPEDLDNGLYLCNGSEWTLIQSLIETLPIFQGTIAGFSAGSGTIDKFPFTSDDNATDVGDLTSNRDPAAGQSSLTHGYVSSNEFEKFPFVSGSNGVAAGNLSVTRQQSTGQSSILNGYGYTSGGYTPGGWSNVIDKFTFSADANATDVGDLTESKAEPSGQSSQTHGYASGGSVGNPSVSYVRTIDKFSFTTNGNASDVGDLGSTTWAATGQSSSTHGYSSGGFVNNIPYPAATSNAISKFPFASDGSVTDVGDLTEYRYQGSGQSSTTYGYVSGGFRNAPFPNALINIIDKFPFASDGNAADVGDLTVTHHQGASGQQH
jgi:hypothetical protein